MSRYILAILIITAVVAQVLERAEACEPFKTSVVGCNFCVCKEDGSGNTCTNLKCMSPRDKLGILLGSLRNKRQAPKATCEPGSSFKKFCNNCRCPNNGLVESAICTKMECIEGVFNEDGSLKRPKFGCDVETFMCSEPSAP